MEITTQQNPKPMDKERVVIFGSTGMAGHVIAQYLQEQGYHVFRGSRSEQNTDTSKAIDITDFGALNMWLDSLKPDIVVNCVGLLQKECSLHPDRAVLINAYFPHWLEAKYADTPVRVIHLSTDCVFSGNRGRYRENDLTDGSSMYDRAKALGELNNDKDLTFRMSIIGPDIDPKGIGLFNWFMQQQEKVQGWRKAIWNGVTTIELARGIDAAIRQGISGLYQLVPNGSIDKCSLLELIRECFQKNNITIEPVDGLNVNKTLVSTRTDFSFDVKPYDEQIHLMKKWIDEHSKIYPHYIQAH